MTNTEYRCGRTTKPLHVSVGTSDEWTLPVKSLIVNRYDYEGKHYVVYLVGAAGFSVEAAVSADDVDLAIVL